jgi:hypothetical protein
MMSSKHFPGWLSVVKMQALKVSESHLGEGPEFSILNVPTAFERGSRKSLTPVMAFRSDRILGDIGRPRNLISDMEVWPARVTYDGRLLIVVMQVDRLLSGIVYGGRCGL